MVVTVDSCISLISRYRYYAKAKHLLVLPEQAPSVPLLLRSLWAPLECGCTPQPLYRSLKQAHKINSQRYG